MKKTPSKFIIIFTLIIFALLLSYAGGTYAFKRYNYSKYYNQAMELLDEENYDEAVVKFTKALQYDDKSSTKISNKIEESKKLKASKLHYDEGVNLFNDRKYIEAIDKYEKVLEADTKRYAMSKEKIKESSKSYIKENMARARLLASSKKYQEAIKYLDNILEFESSNEQATKLKNEYNDIIKKIEEERLKKLEEERLKKLEEERLRKLEENKKTASKAPYTIKKEGNNLKVIMKDGFSYYISCKYMFNDLSPKSQVFSIIIPKDATFELTVHYQDKNVVVKGKPTRIVHVMSGKIPEDRKLSYTFKVFSYGKVYTIKKNFGVSSRLL